MKNLVILVSLTLFSTFICNAQVVITSVNQVYTENFNTLKVTKNSTLVPTGWKIHEKGERAV